MDEPPSAPVPPFAPPAPPADTVPMEHWTPTVPLAEPPIVLPSAPPTGRIAIAKHRLWTHVRAAQAQSGIFGRAVLIALPAGLVASLVIGLVPFVFGDRGFWDAEAHFLVDYWYIPFAVIATFAPVVFVALRDGAESALDLVIDRRYWRVLAAACVVLPFAVAVIVFVASHLLAVILTISLVIVLLLILVITGNGF